MEKLERFFRRGEKKRSDSAVLEDIEAYLYEGELEKAMNLLKDLEKEHNTFLALRMILRSTAKELGGTEEKPSEGELRRIKDIVRELIPTINGISNRRYRAILLSELAIIFYELNDDLNGDIALKTSLDLAADEPDVIRDVLMEFLRRGLMRKVAQAIKMVKDPKGIDVVLARIAENLYISGDEEKALLVTKHITSPFHRALTLYYLGSIEGRRDVKKALNLIDMALKEAEKVENPDARFELILKIYDLKHEILGEGFNVREILSRQEARPV
ncbi:hypothetical protein [Thermococcus sp.]|uniref:hypothetical protein n=1 Tax=Thermococcus sp. TaxID=35749 RepID=UPI0026071203|nr:hypothetical protein [Thermococcus sp.]